MREKNLVLQQEIGKKIKELRIKYGFTQEKFAELVNLEVSFISDIECGKRNISLTTFDSILKNGFNINIFSMFNDEDKNTLTKKDYLDFISDSLNKMDFETVKLFYTLLCLIRK